MLLEAVRWLRDAGVDVQVDAGMRSSDDGRDGVVTLRAEDSVVVFAVQERRRAPYPNEIPDLHQRRETLRAAGHPLIVVPYMPEPAGQQLVTAGWSWADAAGNFDLRAPGMLLRQRRTSQPPKPKRSSLPHGSGSLAIIRALVRFGKRDEAEGGATALAALAGISQPRASQVLGQLADLELVTKTGRGRWRPDREALLDRFLTEYTGPGGSERFCYTLDPPTDVAVALAAELGAGDRVAVSADVGPDLLRAWRRPSLLIVYARSDLDPDTLGLVDAQGRDDANVIVRDPTDQSVYAAPDLSVELRGVDVPLADPTQMLWDLHDLGGADRWEAAGKLRQWLLTPHP